jgi:transitional endoplasmic reticulum ATPase
MLEKGYGYRPHLEAFEVAEGRFELVDPEHLLSDLRADFEPLLHPNTAPAPLLDLDILIAGPARGGSEVRLRGRLTVAAASSEGRVHPAVVGAAYVAPLFDALSRLLAPDSTVKDAAESGSTLEDSASGLIASVSAGRPRLDGRVTHLIDAEVDNPGPEQVRAFVRIVVDVARRLAGRPDDEAFLTGRAYTLSRSTQIVRLDQLGGLDDVVHQLREVADSFRHPEVMARWGARRPQGILMSGPPGTGKTTLAKALATEIGGTLKEIRTPDILDKWVGASERNIKKIFTEARRYRTPTVLLFDEFDSIISYVGAPQGAADQSMNSVTGIFKQEMNTLVEENPNVIVVATTNFPERVDESLVRSGRFDIKIAVPLPDTAARADILTKMLRRLAGRHETNGFRMFADDIDVDQLAVLTLGMSGADLNELLRRVQLAKALQEAREPGAVGAISQADLEAVVAQLRKR